MKKKQTRKKTPDNIYLTVRDFIPSRHDPGRREKNNVNFYFPTSLSDL